MGIRSMTGYGHGEAHTDSTAVGIELSSVNRRQFDGQISLPRSYAVLEPRVLEQLRKSVSRGRVNCTITVRASNGAHGALTIDRARARDGVAELRKCAADLQLKDDLAASLLLHLPGVVKFEDTEESADKVWPICSKALKAALAQLLSARTAEGAVLEKDLTQRAGRLANTLAKIEARAPRVVESYRKTLQARLAKADVEIDGNDERLLRELALFADRCDISEEVTRLHSHLQQVGKLLESQRSVGRELDFLCQEMLREINTIGAKANDSALQKHVVFFKSELERAREQVQNVE